MLLQIMEDGHMSDAKGRKVDFRNTIILMTSNVGADVIGRSTAMGFARKQGTAKTEQAAYDDMKSIVLAELKRIFRPEFMNRIDGIMVFHALSREQIKEIVDLEVNKVSERLASHHLKLNLTDAARVYLADKGYDPNLGARPLRRVIQSEVEDALSEGVLAGNLGKGEQVIVDLQDGELVFLREEIQEVAPLMGDGEAPEALEAVLN